MPEAKVFLREIKINAYSLVLMQFKNCSFASVSEIPSLSLCFNCICISINICIKTWSKEFSPPYFIKVIFVFSLSSVFVFILLFVFCSRVKMSQSSLPLVSQCIRHLGLARSLQPISSSELYFFCIFSYFLPVSLPCICFVFLSNDDNNTTYFYQPLQSCWRFLKRGQPIHLGSYKVP